MHAKSPQFRPTLHIPMACSRPGSCVHGILQPRILEWVAMPSSKDLPDPGIVPEASAVPALQATSLLNNKCCQGCSRSLLKTHAQ